MGVTLPPRTPSLPWEGMGLGILGFCQTRIPTLPSSTVRSLASGSPSFYPTQPSPAAIEDFLTPVQVVLGLGPLPPQASRHTPGPLGNSPAPGVSLGERPSLDPSLLPCMRVCPTSSSTDLPSTGRRNTEALFPRTGPCLGAWPCAQVGGREQNSAKGGRGAL